MLGKHESGFRKRADVLLHGAELRLQPAAANPQGNQPAAPATPGARSSSSSWRSRAIESRAEMRGGDAYFSSVTGGLR